MGLSSASWQKKRLPGFPQASCTRRPVRRTYQSTPGTGRQRWWALKKSQRRSSSTRMQWSTFKLSIEKDKMTSLGSMRWKKKITNWGLTRSSFKSVSNRCKTTILTQSHFWTRLLTNLRLKNAKSTAHSASSKPSSCQVFTSSRSIRFCALRSWKATSARSWSKTAARKSGG